MRKAASKASTQSKHSSNQPTRTHNRRYLKASFSPPPSDTPLLPLPFSLALHTYQNNPEKNKQTTTNNVGARHDRASTLCLARRKKNISDRRGPSRAP